MKRGDSRDTRGVAVAAVNAFGAVKRKEGRIHLILAILFVVSLVSSSLAYFGRGDRLSWSLFAATFLVALAERTSMLTDLRRVAVARRRELAMFALWYVVVLGNAVVGRGYTGTAHVIVATTLAMLVVIDLICTATGGDALNVVRWGVLVLIGVDLARSIPELVFDPLAPRLRMAFGQLLPEFQQSYLWGVGDYGLYTACAITFPLVLAAIVMARGIRRIFWTLLAVGWFSAIFLSTFMGAAILISVGALVYYLLMLRRQSSRVVVLLLGALVLCVLGAVAWQLLSETESGQYIAAKAILERENVAFGGVLEGDQTGRADLWRMSIETFADNPLFGVGPTTMRINPGMGTVVGGHSTLLDIFAEYGIAGALPLILFVYQRARRVMSTSVRSEAEEFVIASRVSFLLFILGGTYNPVLAIEAINAMWIVATLRSEDAGAGRKRRRLVR